MPRPEKKEKITEENTFQKKETKKLPYKEIVARTDDLYQKASSNEPLNNKDIAFLQEYYWPDIDQDMFLMMYKENPQPNRMPIMQAYTEKMYVNWYDELENSDDSNPKYHILKVEEPPKEMDQRSIDEIEALINIFQNNDTQNITIPTNKEVAEKLNTLLNSSVKKPGVDKNIIEKNVQEIIMWIHSSPEHASQFYEYLSTQLDTTRLNDAEECTLPIFFLLGEAIRHRDDTNESEYFLKQMEQWGRLNTRVKNQYLMLSIQNTFATNAVLHTINDFFIRYSNVIKEAGDFGESYVADVYPDYMMHGYWSNQFRERILALDIHNLMETSIPNTTNYLVKLHTEEVANLMNVNEEKNIFAREVNRWNPDDTDRFFLDSKLPQSRVIDDTTIIQIAPYYYGTYKEGGLRKIYQVDETIGQLIPIEKESFFKQIFPLQNYSENELYNYYTLSRLNMRKKIKDGFDIELSDYSLWVQRNFLRYLEQEDIDTVEIFRDHVKRYGADFLKSFVAEEVEGSLSDESSPQKDEMAIRQAILKLSTYGENKTLEPLVKKIFHNYAQFVSSSDEIRNFLISQLPTKNNIEQKTIDSIVKNLAIKGNKILRQLPTKINKKTLEKLLGDLDEANTEILLLGQVFRDIKKEDPTLNFEDFQKLKMNRYDSSELQLDQKQTMTKIADINWSQYPQLHDTVVNELKNAMEIPGKEFDILTFDNEIICFSRFDELKKGDTTTGERAELSARSLNIKKKLKSSRIGETFSKTTLKEKAHEAIIHATAYPLLPIATRYVGEFGFTVHGMIPNYGDSEDTFFDMVIDIKENPHYLFFNKPTEQIKQAFESNDYSKEIKMLSFDLSQSDGYEKMIETCTILLNKDKKVLTAYRHDEETKNILYLVFEPHPDIS